MHAVSMYFYISVSNHHKRFRLGLFSITFGHQFLSIILFTNRFAWRRTHICICWRRKITYFITVNYNRMDVKTDRKENRKRKITPFSFGRSHLTFQTRHTHTRSFSFTLPSLDGNYIKCCEANETKIDFVFLFL